MPRIATNRQAPAGVMGKAWRLATDRSYRSALWLRLTGMKAFQLSSRTYENRYPTIFSFVQTELRVTPRARILSFGCSTGEEVFWLRRYFRDAVIKGIDLNVGSIATCRERAKREGDDNVSFAVADCADGEPADFYDALFCMAVLRDGRLSAPGVERCDHLIRFGDFDRMVDGFARCLRPGGLLVIRHSNFRLGDTRTGAAFQTVLRLRDTTGRCPIFGPDNRLIVGADYRDTVFRKAV
jgi:SAM-dependent methyltransferase